MVNTPGHEHFSYAFQRQLNYILQLVGEKENKNILVLGRGSNFLQEGLSSQGYNVHRKEGADLPEKDLAILGQHKHRFNQETADDAPALPAPLLFDLVIATEVIEHVTNSLAFITLCRRYLQPGGELIVTAPYHGYLKNIVISLFNKWDEDMDPKYGGHVRLLSKKTLAESLRSNGFKVTAFKGFGKIPYVWESMLIKARLYEKRCP